MVINKIDYKKIYIDEILQSANKIILLQKTLNLESNQDLYVIIKNVKTREEFRCEHSVEDNKIILNLAPLVDKFSDYEGYIYIVCEKNMSTYMYSPIVTKKTIVNVSNDISNIYNWHMRVIENGELRFASIIKK